MVQRAIQKENASKRTKEKARKRARIKTVKKAKGRRKPSMAKTIKWKETGREASVSILFKRTHSRTKQKEVFLFLIITLEIRARVFDSRLTLIND